MGTRLESLDRFAVRMEPAQIVATGTPKMGHGLVAPARRRRDASPSPGCAPGTTSATSTDSPIKQLYEQNAGTVHGKQELEGEWIWHLEGDLLKRAWWRYYPPQTKQRD